MLPILLTVALSANLRGLLGRQSVSPQAAGNARAYQTQHDNDAACPGPNCGMVEGFNAFKTLLEEGTLLTSNLAALDLGVVPMVGGFSTSVNSLSSATQALNSNGPAMNTDSNCLTWAQSGQCTKNPDYMNRMCAKSCGTGTTGELRTTAPKAHTCFNWWAAPQCAMACPQLKSVASSGLQPTCNSAVSLVTSALATACTSGCSAQVQACLRDMTQSGYCGSQLAYPAVVSTATAESTESTQCSFPFVFRNKPYSACTTVGDSAGKPWCSTKVDGNGVHVSGGGHFRYCSDTMPPLQTTTPSVPLSITIGSFDGTTQTTGVDWSSIFGLANGDDDTT